MTHNPVPYRGPSGDVNDPEVQRLVAEYRAWKRECGLDVDAPAAEPTPEPAPEPEQERGSGIALPALFCDGGVIGPNPSAIGGTSDKHEGQSMLSENDIKRFWSKVQIGNADECWPWLAGRHTKGYGVVFIQGKNIGAHRVSLMIKLGRDLRPDHFACHTCDNPICVNPAHLWEDTPENNTHDMLSKGRNKYETPIRYGEDHPNAKLSADKVREIRRRSAAGETNTAIAAHLGVARKTVAKILSGETWKDV